MASGETQPVADLSRIWPGIEEGQYEFGFGTDQSGWRLVIATSDEVRSYLYRGAPTVGVVPRLVAKVVLGGLNSFIERTGIAFRPGTQNFAISVPGSIGKGSSDGSSLPRCIIVGGPGHKTSVGPGKPVAWISSTELLCAKIRRPDLLAQPTIYNIRTGKVAHYDGWGWDVGWDGSHVLLLSKKGVTVIDRSLRHRTKSIAVTTDRNPTFLGAHVGIVGISALRVGD